MEPVGRNEGAAFTVSVAVPDVEEPQVRKRYNGIDNRSCRLLRR